jgi:hypothetical protein
VSVESTPSDPPGRWHVTQYRDNCHLGDGPAEVWHRGMGGTWYSHFHHTAPVWQSEEALHAAHPYLVPVEVDDLPALIAEVQQRRTEVLRVGLEYAQAAGELTVVTRERDALAVELAKVTTDLDDALQVVADLGGAGMCGTTIDSPLIGHAPPTCELTAGHAGWHRTSDGRTFTERGVAGVGEPRTRLLVWDCGEQPDLAELRQAITDLSGGRLHMAEASHTGTQDYAVLLSDQPVTEAQASEAYRQRGEGDGG